MAAKNYEICLNLVLKHEGGFSNHPADPGGATNLGVTQKSWSAWIGRPATIEEIKDLTYEKVRPFYKARYWDKIRGDDLPSGVDYMVFDFAVNSGVKRASKYLQLLIGAHPDGDVGPVTVGLTNQYIIKNSFYTIINEYCEMRIRFLRGLKTFGTFGRGWMNRVNAVRGLILSGTYG